MWFDISCCSVFLFFQFSTFALLSCMISVPLQFGRDDDGSLCHFYSAFQPVVLFRFN